jgi:hypothetical protein
MATTAKISAKTENSADLANNPVPITPGLAQANAADAKTSSNTTAQRFIVLPNVAVSKPLLWANLLDDKIGLDVSNMTNI